jgi:hypothetical protein
MEPELPGFDLDEAARVFAESMKTVLSPDEVGRNGWRPTR